jgi:hypothetical protein
MSRKRLFLVLALVLAVAWTAWLGYQAATVADPIVVSRPQILVAPVVVEAVVGSEGGGRPLQVVKVYRGQETLGLPAGEVDPVGLEINVPELADEPPGNYLLALQEELNQKGVFVLVPIPESPGFRKGDRTPPIYLATPSTRFQVRETLREYHKRLAGE